MRKSPLVGRTVVRPTAHVWLGRALMMMMMMMAVGGIQSTFAAEIRGQVVDKTTGNPLPDVNIALDVTRSPIRTDMSGRFAIDSVEDGKLYHLSLSHVAYQPASVDAVGGGKPVTVELTQLTYEMPQVVINAGRGVVGKTPATLSNIDRKYVELNYGVQDVPQLAGEIPSAVAFSWSGSDVGASQLKIRGFDTDRLSATVEGIPINDPTEHIVYFQDTPDFLSNSYDIQVESGVGDVSIQTY